jgi:DNA/RNA-binding domain of Phe-tRNA-synthetase-like protein
MRMIVSDEVRSKFPDLHVLLKRIDGVSVRERSEELERFKAEVYQRIRSRFSLRSLKDDPVIRAYRDFFWRIGVDPTKIRPASEALIRRILGGGGLPTINTLVDAYNLASVGSRIALAAFDADKLEGEELVMRFARSGEEFLGIGMDKPRRLEGGEIVVADSKRLIAIYPYRDADYSKVTLETRSIYLMTCGVPGIGLEKLREAEDLAAQYIIRFCVGAL